MTRFARAKGSKASNERVPEKATSWAEMKEQLLSKTREIGENKKRQEIHNQRNANYKAFLEEREENESKKVIWADFPGNGSRTKPYIKNTQSKTHRNNKSCNNKESSDDDEFKLLKEKVDEALSNADTSTNISNNKNQIDTSLTQTRKLKKRKAQHAKCKGIEAPSEESITLATNSTAKIESDSDAPPDEQTAKEYIAEPVVKVKKSKQKKLKIVINSDKQQKEMENQNHKINKSEKAKRELLQIDVGVNKKFKSSETENKHDLINKGNQNKKVINENLSESSLKKIEKKKQKRLKQVLKKKRVKEELIKQKQLKESMPNENKTNCDNEPNAVSITNVLEKSDQSVGITNVLKKSDKSKKKCNKNNFKAENKKEKCKNEAHSRKKPFLPHKMFINGKELEIEYLDGFPIRKEDAERIKKLKKEMICKGLPRSEINIALKLERRKAEKALTREKKKVCYQCRKSGHNLSECPELNKDQIAQTAGSGICFKCGSTEHTHFECKVVRGQEFKFAQCFICNEQGHIARQCPDNARGLYPKGGACKICGDVTHLKKDCPTYQSQQQKQEGALKIEMFGNSNPDVLEEHGDTSINQINKRPNKIIKF